MGKWRKIKIKLFDLKLNEIFYTWSTPYLIVINNVKVVCHNLPDTSRVDGLLGLRSLIPNI
jgi:hypothetical protein